MFARGVRCMTEGCGGVGRGVVASWGVGATCRFWGLLVGRTEEGVGGRRTCLGRGSAGSYSVGNRAGRRSLGIM